MKCSLRFYSTILKPRKSLRESLGKSDMGYLFSLTERNSRIDKVQTPKPTQNHEFKIAVDMNVIKQNSSRAMPLGESRTENSIQKKMEVLTPPGKEDADIFKNEIEDYSKSKFLKKGADRDKLKRQREREKKMERRSKDSYSNVRDKSKTKNIYLQEGITIANLSSLMNVPVKKILRKMVQSGFEQQTPDYVLNSEIASLIVMEFNMNPILSQEDSTDLEPRPDPEDWSVFPHRPPVITIMGHVDHGKTTLLDSLRKTSVAAGEAGGITQHIGAFSVVVPSGKQITFLDTPGHAAFSQMRQRGAQCTDIIVLVVAVDDGVMPQTIEAIQHAHEAQAPIIVALNKCDKHSVNPTKVLEELLQHSVIVEEMGGDVPCVRISGKTGAGLEELEETILTLSDILDIRGDSSGMVEGTIVEAKMSKEFGNVATVLIKRGTLTPGAIIVAGNSWCKVKRMINDKGVMIASAGPSTPVEVFGWKHLPEAGDVVIESKNEVIAKQVSKNRIRKQEFLESVKDIDALNEKKVILDEKVVEDYVSKLKEYRVIVKCILH
jgi:translation initiation factor IF-2